MITKWDQRRTFIITFIPLQWAICGQFLKIHWWNTISMKMIVVIIIIIIIINIENKNTT